MKTSSNSKSDPASLRLKAEELLKRKPPEKVVIPSEADMLKLIHNLEVHKVELEMQNDELVLAIAAAKDAVELYDFAPSGYFTLNNTGEIIRLNLLGAKMLGKERSRLKNSSFAFFVSNDTKHVFNSFLARVFSGHKSESCELILIANGNPPLHVYLSGISIENGDLCLLTALDITERKQAEEALEKSRLLLKASLESQKDTALLSIDRDYRYLYFNQAHCDTMKFSYNRDVKLGMNILDCITADTDRKVAKENYDRALRGESHSNIRIYGNVKLAYFESFFNPIVDENGQVIGATALARNITQRKAEEEALENNLALTEATLESIHNGILVVTSKGTIIRSNAKFAEMWNIPADMLNVRDDKMLLDYVIGQLADPEEFLAKIAELNNNPFAESRDLIIFRDGRIFERISKPMFVNGEAEGRVWSYLDITERNHAEQALTDSEVKYRKLVENLPDAIIIYLEGKVAYVNKETLSLMEAASADDLIGKPVMQFVHPDSRALVVERMTKVMDEGVVLPMIEERFIRANGSIVDVEVKAISVRFENKPAVQLVVRDVTKRKQSETELSLKNDALAKLNQFSMGLSGISAEDDLGVFIAKQLKELTGCEVAIFSEFNSENRTTTVRHIEMEAGLLGKVMRILGKPLKDIHSPVSDKLYSEMTTDRVGMRNTLHGISFGSVPRPVGAAIEALLKVDRFFGLAYIIEGKLYGTSVLGMKKGHPDPPKQLLENFIFMAAVSLRRKQAEQELKKSESQKSTLINAIPDMLFIQDKEGVYLDHHAPESVELYTTALNFIGKNMRDVLPPLIARDYKLVFDKALQTKQEQFYEYSLPIHDGIGFFESRTVAYEDDKVLSIIRDITDRKKQENRIEKLNECFLRFEADPLVNINLLVALCGEMLGATCALYNRIEGNMLCSFGQWNTPPGYQSSDPAEGHICTDVIRSTDESIIIIRNLQDSAYALSDPNVKLYQLATYIGKAVKFNNSNIGSLCVVFQKDVVPDKNDIHLMEIIASAIGVEEERRHSAEAIKLSEERFRALAETLSVGIFLTDLEGKCNYVNEKWCLMTQLSFGQALDDGWVNGIYEEDRQLVLDNWKKMIASHGNWGLEYRLGTKDKIVWVYSTANNFMNDSGEIIGYVGTNADITERKQAGQALKENEEKLRIAYLYARSLLEASLDPLVTINADGKITDVNSATEKVTGLLRKALIGTDFCDYFSDPAQARTGYKKVFEDGFVIDYPLTIRHKSGRLTDVLYNASIYRDETDRILGIFATARDITARKRAEEEIRLLNTELEQRLKQRTQQLENANRELEAFSYSVAHNLRSPLRGIDGWSMALLEDYNNILDEQGRIYLSRVRNEAQQMGNLIDDLLKLSRVTQMDLRPEIVDLSALVKSIAHQFSLSQNDRKFEFIIEPGLSVKGDLSMLQIVITNLLNNACKFTRNERVSRIEFGKQMIDGKPAFFMRDNGVGFIMENAENLFRAFHRLHKPSDYPGSGVGLATVKRIITLHEGYTWAVSKPGEGATFFFTLNTK